MVEVEALVIQGPKMGTVVSQVKKLDVSVLVLEMPIDPVSDPISDSKVLPMPAGKSNFGAGAQLKNVIGNWSRWLSDLFGLEDDSADDIVILKDEKRLKSFKAFRLLHALSDLMMLPFGMLADVSTRKGVGSQVLKSSRLSTLKKSYMSDDDLDYYD
ncbi:hypothetical protein PHJA_000967100 [Phtheirospermum japonicum]|uniref:Uncharacterized protein n=1 Tax=Phtheirospermum japonicum TaxID=374723 RepID=A0A830BV19_9LAMI|nr:hypothetical protein PHJA_000967100 [Phtheirospermum japonicum]